PRSVERATHYDVPATLDLTPGRYEIRLGMESETASLRGSAFMSIVVPDFAKVPLSMSGLVLSVQPAPPPSGRDLLAGVLPMTPTTRRTFMKTDVIGAMLRVYQGRS